MDVAGFDVAERAAVRVRDVQCSSGVATGSGFALDAHTLVTNRHVVADAARVQVDTYDGHELAVTSVAVSESADLAVLHTRQALPATLVLAGPGAAADPAPGQPVSVVGYPLGGQLATRRGTVSGTGPDPLATMTAPVLDLAVRVAPGSSGSPVLDAAGRVVGVVYAGAEEGSTSYAVPVPVLAAALATLRSTGRAPACG